MQFNVLHYKDFCQVQKRRTSTCRAPNILGGLTSLQMSEETKQKKNSRECNAGQKVRNPKYKQMCASAQYSTDIVVSKIMKEVARSAVSH